MAVQNIGKQADGETLILRIVILSEVSPRLRAHGVEGPYTERRLGQYSFAGWDISLVPAIVARFAAHTLHAPRAR